MDFLADYEDKVGTDMKTGRGSVDYINTFEYGQKHSLELELAKANTDYLKENNIFVEHIIVNLTSAMDSFHSALISENIAMPEGHYEEEQMKQTVVPNRNAIFSSIIYGHALSKVEKTNEDTKAIGISATIPEKIIREIPNPKHL